LDMRNAQISDLQQQILGFENEKEKEKEVRTDRWTKLSTMVEAKLAVQYLFDQATEALASSALKSQDVRELNLQLSDLRKNYAEIRESKSSQRRHHDEEIVRMEREHEEKILFLLRQLASKDPPESSDVSLNQDIADVAKRLQFQNDELAKMSEIHDKLMQRDEEVASLKMQLESTISTGQGNLFAQLGKDSPVKKKKDSKRVTIKIERYSNPEEYFNDQDYSSDSSVDSSADEDDDWRKTPLLKRIRQERRSMAPHLSKRKRESQGSDEESGDSSINGTKRKTLQGCTCKKGCKTKACSCKKKSIHCVAICKCDPHACANRENPGTDVSSSVETDKENDLMDDTDQLLDSTYNLGTTNAASIIGKTSPAKPIFKSIISGADIFAADSDIESTPKMKKGPALQEKIFNIPNID